jgi:hypothetical protein
MWSTACQRSFKRLRKSFVSVAIFYHFDAGRKIVVETDLSHLIIARALSEYDVDDILHQMAYISKKYSPAKVNNDIDAKALLIIVKPFKGWPLVVEGSPQIIKVISDH